MGGGGVLRLVNAIFFPKGDLFVESLFASLNTSPSEKGSTLKGKILHQTHFQKGGKSNLTELSP